MNQEDQEKFNKFKAEQDEDIRAQEFNRAVAEKIFGLKVGFDSNKRKIQWADDQELETRYYFIADKTGNKKSQMSIHPLLAPPYIPMFNYAGSLTKFATWHVVDEMKRKGWLLRLSVFADYAEACFVRDGSSSFTGLTRDADAGVAICKAALNTVETP